MIYTDQTGRTITLSSFPTKIVSLVPSQTELLFYLGLNDEVVGITKFCVHPQNWFNTKTRIGGTKNLNIEKIRSLSPDLIIANKEENVKEQIEALENIAPVWVSDVNDFDDALRMIKMIGTITNKTVAAQNIASQIKNKFAQLSINSPLQRACYLIWKDPYMSVGGDTFISSIMQQCGLQNVFEQETRYPGIQLKQLAALNCELILLSSEPYPFQQKHISEIQEQMPGAGIILVNGEMFSWYGSRMLLAADYFQQLMNKINSNG
ncbi:vitamin B12-binding protein precursor [mine drainage metagenome]|uniref:Vitamin B12-binding protein n=1 Tax=mine drainage metagenome TaxID=410659 RepID=A0A1J5RX44_9ZZZZ